MRLALYGLLIAVPRRARHNRLLIQVVDQGHGFERILRERDRIGGRGLNIVDALARRWGIHDGSSHVGSTSSDADRASDRRTSPRADPRRSCLKLSEALAVG